MLQKVKRWQSQGVNVKAVIDINKYEELIPWQQPLKECDDDIQLLMLVHWICKSNQIVLKHIKLRCDFIEPSVTAYVGIWRNNNKVFIEYVH